MLHCVWSYLFPVLDTANVALLVCRPYHAHCDDSSTTHNRLDCLPYWPVPDLTRYSAYRLVGIAQTAQGLLCTAPPLGFPYVDSAG